MAVQKRRHRLKISGFGISVSVLFERIEDGFGGQNIIAGRILSSGDIYVQTGQSGSAKATG